MEKISNTQKKIYEFLVEKSQGGVPPSIREIGAAVGLKSTSTVHAHLVALEKAGYIMRDPLLKRAIRILGQDDAYTQVPLIGTVTAGIPILAVEQIESYVPYSGYVSKDKPLFALHVKGESMINAGIYDGDIIVVNQQNTANNGEIVVALVDDSATVKRLIIKDNKIILHPENDNMQDMYFEDVIILGVVKGLMRKF